MKAKSFSPKLLSWYAKNARDLPWRQTIDPFKIWLSEVMLQQTTVAAVIPFYEKWVARFQNVHDLARAKEQTVLNLWQGLGYYQRARNLHKAAKYISLKLDGKIPDSCDELRKLPGFGPYTTAAVASIAFNKVTPVVDANVRRVVMRLLEIEGKIDLKNDVVISAFLEKVISKRNPGDFNQAMMELGATICRPKQPLCLQCPVHSFCKAYDKGVQECIPQKTSKVIQEFDVAIAVLKKGKDVLIQKRPEKGLLAGLWEFPGGKVEKTETPKNALVREIQEELQVDLNDIKFILKTKHYYTTFKVNLHVFTCRPLGNPRSNLALKWVTIRKLSSYPMPSGSAKIVEYLRKLL